MRLLVLVDGEHYPPSVRFAIESLDGHDVAGAVFCGGGEKVDIAAIDDAYGVPVESGPDLRGVLARAIDRFEPEAVLDMTDEPVLSPQQRFALAAVALSRGLSYRGADFELRPPVFEPVLTKPAVSIFATGKRTGKTAIASALARHAVARGRSPVIVAVGRGGPNPPRVIEPGALLDARSLLELADAGEHAASDYVEDAVTSGVATIGCVRVGGGLAGATIRSNMADGARIAQGRAEDLVILEGSGASIPEVRAGAAIICIPAGIAPAAVTAYLNPFRLLLADLCVVTMAENGSAAADVVAAIQGARPELLTVQVVFRPTPLGDIRGRRVLFCTTSPLTVGPVLKEHLEREHGCEVVGMTHRLADRRELPSDLSKAPSHDVMLLEIKAAAIDVAVRSAAEQGTDVMFVDNRPSGTRLEESFDHILAVADG